MEASEATEPIALTSSAVETTSRRGLRRGLGLLLVIGVSISLMGPSLSANIDAQPAAPLVGRAVPLTFVIATVGVLFVAWAFIRLSQYFNSAGSVFGLVGATLGPRAGTFAGWALMGTYTLFAVTSATAAGIFTKALVAQLGIWANAPNWFMYVVALAVLAFAFVLAVVPIHSGTRVLLILEAGTVTLVLLVCVVTVIRLIGGGAPNHHGAFTLSVFAPAQHQDVSSLFLGVVYGFLAFGGFEGAATMGDEALNPRREIPVALLGTVFIGGLFYIVTTAVMVMGFGTTTHDLQALVASGSPLGYLGTNFVASWVGDVITIGTIISAFGGVVGLTIGASRLLFALSNAASQRDHALTRTSDRWGTPVGAAVTVFSVAVLIVVIFAWLFRSAPGGEFGYLGTMGTLFIMTAYMMMVIGATVHFFVRRPPEAAQRVARWEIVIPLAAVVVVGYTVYRNLVPYPTGNSFWVPIATGAWLAVVLAAVVGSPRLARRIGVRLVEDEGLAR